MLPVPKTDDVGRFKQQRSTLGKHGFFVRQLRRQRDRPGLPAGQRKLRRVFGQPQAAGNPAGAGLADVAGDTRNLGIVEGIDAYLVIGADQFPGGGDTAQFLRLHRKSCAQQGQAGQQVRQGRESAAVSAMIEQNTRRLESMANVHGVTPLNHEVNHGGYSLRSGTWPENPPRLHSGSARDRQGVEAGIGPPAHVYREVWRRIAAASPAVAGEPFPPCHILLADAADFALSQTKAAKIPPQFPCDQSHFPKIPTKIITMSELKRTDMTRPADLLQHGKGTGPFRTQRPVYFDLLPPCNNACPAGENIQAWLAHVQAGQYRKAWETLVRDNPMPAVHGRVCYHPCESSCNRKAVDSPVSIHAVERFLGDMALREGWTLAPEAPPSGKRILVVGAGPSGLSAAWHLAHQGHSVEIHEAGPVPGGMMHFGIPAYRLPRAELMAEIRRIESLGVRIVLNRKVTDILAEKEKGGFDAVFVAVGAHLSKRVEIPARDAGKILDAVSFLRDANTGQTPLLGRRVAVYGGGNTAMDAARTARRLGAEEALIIYRRDREHMPAHSFEADEAIEEGVKINWLRTIKEIDQTHITVEVMKINAEGYPEPTGEVETLEADALILALGQDTDTGFLKNIAGIDFKRDGTVMVDANMMTGHAGIFAGGDMVPSERTVTIAVGHGKKAARCIDAWLRGETYTKAPKHELAGFDKLHLWYFTEAQQRQQNELELEERRYGFTEVVAGLSEGEAGFEAKRCFSCGNCFECDGCYGACPEQAITKLGPGKKYRYEYERCTGCAVCFEQCPCHAIEMVAEAAA